MQIFNGIILDKIGVACVQKSDTNLKMCYNLS